MLSKSLANLTTLSASQMLGYFTETQVYWDTTRNAQRSKYLPHIEF